MTAMSAEATAAKKIAAALAEPRWLASTSGSAGCAAMIATNRGPVSRRARPKPAATPATTAATPPA